MIASVLFSALLAAAPTMRLDYYHSGNRTTEIFSVDRIVIEPLPWPGSPGQAIDETNVGKYLFEVVDRGTNRVVFSRGFASIYGEWETTDEAARVNRTFHESLRFPAPAARGSSKSRTIWGKWVRSRAQCTRPKGTTGPRSTASCSPEARRSAPSAAGRSKRSSISIRGDGSGVDKRFAG